MSDAGMSETPIRPTCPNCAAPAGDHFVSCGRMRYWCYKCWQTVEVTAWVPAFNLLERAYMVLLPVLQ